MLELLIATIGLGIAGIDPIGALIAIGALSNGARERSVVIFGFAQILVTVALGVTLSLLVGTRLAEIDWTFLDAGDPIWAVGEAIVGIVLLVWAIRRVLWPAPQKSRPASRAVSVYALGGLGVLSGASAVLDPTFVALVVLAGRDGVLVNVTLAHLLWILISQLPLVVVMVAIMRGRHHTVISRLQAWWASFRPVMAKIGTIAALVVAIVLLVDAGWWFATGGFLIEF